MLHVADRALTPLSMTAPSWWNRSIPVGTGENVFVSFDTVDTGSRIRFPVANMDPGSKGPPPAGWPSAGHQSLVIGEGKALELCQRTVSEGVSS